MSFQHTIYINNISMPTRKGDVITTDHAKIATAMAWNEGVSKVLGLLGVTGQAYTTYMDQAGKKVPKAAKQLVDKKKERSAQVMARAKAS